MAKHCTVINYFGGLKVVLVNGDTIITSSGPSKYIKNFFSRDKLESDLTDIFLGDQGITINKS
ncbi:MAG: hypothetical protein ACFFD2_02230 [Promethearchaeota archaeon]